MSARITLSAPSNLRRKLLAACLPAMAVMLPCTSADAGTFSWNTGDGSWHNPANWTPGGVPGLDDTIGIGDLPGVQESTVLLGSPGVGYDLLEISSGMTLDTAGGQLVSFDDVFITGNNSRLIVRPSLGPNFHDLNGTLRLGAGGTLDLRDNAVRVFDTSWSSGVITGRGLLELSTVTPFNNNGIFRPTGNGGLRVTTVHPVDLDGSTDNGKIQQPRLLRQRSDLRMDGAPPAERGHPRTRQCRPRTRDGRPAHDGADGASTSPTRTLIVTTI